MERLCCAGAHIGACGCPGAVSVITSIRSRGLFSAFSRFGAGCVTSYACFGCHTCAFSCSGARRTNRIVRYACCCPLWRTGACSSPGAACDCGAAVSTAYCE